MSDRFLPRGFQARDIAGAASLLTIFPLPVDHATVGARAARSVWAYPLVGAALGALAAIVAGFVEILGAPAGIVAVLALAVLALGTGAMHEDGLADCADGLGGGRDKEHRLQIMKDSRIGAFGAVALGISLLARWSALEGLVGTETLFWPLVAVGAVSRLPMVLTMFLLQPARKDGLASDVGLPPPDAVAGAMGTAILAAFLGLGWNAVPLLFWSLLIVVPLLWIVRKLLDGYTGDVLGATQQLAEIAGLSVAVAVLT